MADRYDIVVVGGGPGGYASALYGSAAGMRVALVEANVPGGTCLNRGCIPAKALLQTAETMRAVRGAGDFGVDAGLPSLDWKRAIERQGEVVDRLVGGLKGLLKKRKVDVVEGYGRVARQGVVEVDTGGGVERIEGDSVVIAAGSVPRSIPGFAIDGASIVTSDQALFFEELPESVAIIGGGVIGVEFATTFVDCGVSVLLLEALDQLVPGCEPELARLLQRGLKKRGVEVFVGARVTGHRPGPDSMVTLSFDHKADHLESEIDTVLVSVGRGPNTAGMELGSAGIAVDERGYVVVDKSNMRASAEGVWAVGDCVDTPQLAHVAYAEAMVAVRDILGEDPAPVNYDAVPFCVYSHPEIAWVGLTEQQARERGHDVAISRHGYGGVGRAMILGEAEGTVKLVHDADSGTLLGAHLCGPWATEQMVEGYLAVNWEATVGDVAHLVHPHPTLSEAFGEAAMHATGRGLHG